MESSLGGRSDLSTSCCSSVESSEEQDRGPSPYSPQTYITGSSCSALNWRDQVCGPFSSLHSYGQDSDSDCLSSLGDYSLALAGLRGSVSQGDPCYAGPFFKDVERDVREEEDELSAADSVINEGIIFYNEVCSVLRQSTSCLLFWFKVWFCQTNLLLFCSIRKSSRWTLNTRKGGSISSQNLLRKAPMVRYTVLKMPRHASNLLSKRWDRAYWPLCFVFSTARFQSALWLLTVFFHPHRSPWRGSAVRRWVRGVPSDLLVWWNSLEWSERGLMCYFSWTSNLVCAPHLCLWLTALFFSTRSSGWKLLGEMWWIKYKIQHMHSWCKMRIMKTSEIRMWLKMWKWVVLGCQRWLMRFLEVVWSKLYFLTTLFLCHKITGHNGRSIWIWYCVLVNINQIKCSLCPGLTLSVVSGSLGQLIAECGRLPEDLSLHYHLQVLTALEYLVKKKVVHLDIKGTIYKGIFCQLIFLVFTIIKLMFESYMSYAKKSKYERWCQEENWSDLLNCIF